MGTSLVISQGCWVYTGLSLRGALTDRSAHRAIRRSRERDRGNTHLVWCRKH